MYLIDPCNSDKRVWYCTGYHGCLSIMLSLRYFLNIAPLSEVIEGSGLSIEIEVDSGINTETARLCVEAGASVL